MVRTIYLEKTRMMLACMLLLSLGNVVGFPISYALSDIQYPTPLCSSKGTLVVNSFGHVLLDNDLMGSQLQLQVQVDPSQSSCRFCRISPTYCTTPYGNASNLHMAYDTSYNFRLITLDGENRTLTSLSVASLPSNGAALTLERHTQICGETYRIILLLMMTAEAPLVRDFLLIARDTSLLLIPSLPCSTDPSQADLSCRVADAYFYLDYRVENCVSSSPSSTSLPPAGGKTFVYYYYQVIVRGEPFLMDKDLTLCREGWISIYRRVYLERYCDADNRVYIAMKPWYRAALYAIAAWSNGRRDTSVWLALETLEKYCVAREVVLDLFHNLSLLVGEPSDKSLSEDWALLCNWSVENTSFHIHENVTLPFYYYHYRDWYFENFKYLVYYDAQMPLKSGLIVAFLTLCAVFSMGAGIYTVAFIIRTRLQYKDYQSV